MSVHHYLEECCERLNSSWWFLFSCSPNTEPYPEEDKSITKFFHSKGHLIMVKIISSQTFVWYIVIGKQFHADLHILAPYRITFKIAYIWHSTVAFIITHIHTNSYTQYIYTYTQISILLTPTKIHTKNEFSNAVSMVRHYAPFCYQEESSLLNLSGNVETAHTHLAIFHL
jgi:hypothetical protein